MTNYQLKHAGAEAQGRLNSDGSFSIFGGAVARADTGSFRNHPKSGEIRADLIRTSTLVPSKKKPGSLELVDATTFNSASQATGVLVGRDASGPERWINVETGLSLAEEQKRPSSPTKIPTKKQVRWLEHPEKREINGWRRNPAAAAEAKKRAGYECEACSMSFQKTYGKVGEHFLEAHHRFPLSHREREAAEITANDLLALCANCHRIVHRLLASGQAQERDQLAVIKNILKGNK